MSAPVRGWREPCTAPAAMLENRSPNLRSAPTSSRDARIEALPALMRSLYRTGAYYVSIPPGVTPDYEAAYWHRVVDPDGRARDRLAERDQHVQDLAQELAYLEGLPRGRILDAGCGLGHFLSALEPGWERHGIELSAFAAERAAAHGEVRQASVEACPYPDAVFDVAFCHHVIEHVPQPERALAELRRVLRPGGLLILGTPDFDSAAARRFGPRYRLLADPTHVSLFSCDSMHRFLRDHGFVIRAVEFPYFETRHFTRENLLRMLDADAVSPPFYGSFMTFYAERTADEMG